MAGPGNHVFGDMLLWAWLMLRHWAVLVTGGIAIALIAVAALYMHGDSARYVQTATGAWMAFAVLLAAFQTWRTEYALRQKTDADIVKVQRALTESQRELATIEDKKPKLITEILAVYDSAVNDGPSDLVVTMNVRVENHGPEPTTLSGIQTRVLHEGQEYTGNGFDLPMGFAGFRTRDRRMLPLSQNQFLEFQGELRARSKIEGFVISMFRGVAHIKFSDLTLQVRVQGIGCAWSDWAGFQPPMS